MALDEDDREEVLAELIALVEQGSQARDKSDATTPEVDLSFTDKAEAFVLAHPTGVSTSQVGQAIGQKITSVDGTLRSLCKSRRTIERRDGRWFPAARPSSGKAPSHRDAIMAVLMDSKRPLGAGEIIGFVQQAFPDRKRPSLESEIHRMRGDKILGEMGTNGRGALYGLLIGGEPTDA